MVHLCLLQYLEVKIKLKRTDHREEINLLKVTGEKVDPLESLKMYPW